MVVVGKSIFEIFFPLNCASICQGMGVCGNLGTVGSQISPFTAAIQHQKNTAEAMAPRETLMLQMAKQVLPASFALKAVHSHWLPPLGSLVHPQREGEEGE